MVNEEKNLKIEVIMPRVAPNEKTWVVKEVIFDGDEWILPPNAVVVGTEWRNYIDYDNGQSIEYKEAYFQQPGKIIKDGRRWIVTYIIPKK